MDKIIKYKNKINESITKKKSSNIKISKTLNSVIFIISEIMYCFSTNNFKKLKFLYDNIYFNDNFHLLIKKYYIYFQIIDVYVKNNYIILHGINNNILINKNNLFFLDKFEVIELYQYTLFFNSVNSFIVDEFGNIEKKQPCKNKINLFYNIIKNVGNIDNFIDLIV